MLRKDLEVASISARDRKGADGGSNSSSVFKEADPPTTLHKRAVRVVLPPAAAQSRSCNLQTTMRRRIVSAIAPIESASECEASRGCTHRMETEAAR